MRVLYQIKTTRAISTANTVKSSQIVERIERVNKKIKLIQNTYANFIFRDAKLQTIIFITRFFYSIDNIVLYHQRIITFARFIFKNVKRQSSL